MHARSFEACEYWISLVSSTVLYNFGSLRHEDISIPSRGPSTCFIIFRHLDRVNAIYADRHPLLDRPSRRSEEG